MPIIVLIGTKAQFIKTAPILREFDQRAIPYHLVYTGQHSETFELLENAFSTKPPDDQMVAGMEASTHNKLLTWLLRFGSAAIRRRSKWKGAPCGLVHGDTASTLAGAMALRLAGVPVVHVEAGLRSPRLLEPFPEEIIRRLVSRLAQLHLAPDQIALEKLENARGHVVGTHGNTLRDALVLALSGLDDVPRAGGGGGYAIVSIHRSENLGRKRTFDFLMNEVLQVSQVLPVKFVLHPTTREKVRSSGWLPVLQAAGSIALTERMGYVDFVKLLVESCCLFTDGGSNQEEAAMMGLPTLLMRNETERPDGIGANVTLSRMTPGMSREFAVQHAQNRWPMKLVLGPSPSAIAVDAMASFYTL